MQVKICGITNLEDALNAINLGADFLGFVFYKKSPRSISVSDAKKIIELLPKSVGKVGVFVDAPELTIKSAVKKCNLDYIQLHGDEDAAFCKKLSNKGKIKIIKAFRIKDAGSLKQLADYEVDAYLLDAFDEKVRGGSGKNFNWGLLSKIKNLEFNIILSGGLNSKNVKKLIKRFKPYAVDVSSGVERTAGKKDYRLMRDFILSAKEAYL
ncbi:MAG: phosphoribosylanthranilate isomerase [Candidatus Omnitrophica bacterium]|nr:phosphoribosylanthranilate isomerase [Candidatus Omnitrophota bacterium]